MSASTLQIDPRPARRRVFASYFPWIVVLTCAAVLAVLLFQLIQDIPRSLQAQASQLVLASSHPEIQVDTDGRDLHLGGTLEKGESLDSLIQALRDIDGVRTVKDKVTIVDPEVEAARKSELFIQELQAVDSLSVAFKPGSVSFTLDSEPALQALYAVMSKHADQRIRIEGHTDNTGPDAVNLRLSQDRAAAVANYLSGRGIAPDRLIVKGYGSTQPIDSNDTDAGRSRNRRIEISHVY